MKIKPEILFENSKILSFGGKIEPFRDNHNHHPEQIQKKSIFEKLTSFISRSILKAKKTNVEPFPSSSLERQRNMRQQINLVLKEVMYNSMAQAMIKIFQTPHLTLKLALILFVLLTISIR